MGLFAIASLRLQAEDGGQQVPVHREDMGECRIFPPSVSLEHSSSPCWSCLADLYRQHRLASFALGFRAKLNRGETPAGEARAGGQRARYLFLPFLSAWSCFENGWILHVKAVHLCDSPRSSKVPETSPSLGPSHSRCFSIPCSSLNPAHTFINNLFNPLQLPL